MNKKEMIAYLVDELGVNEKELKDSNGNFLTVKKLQELITRKESQGQETVVAIFDEFNESKDYEDEVDDFLDVTVEKANKKSFEDNDQIVVMSGINGDYTHHSVETGRSYRFKGFGQTAKMPYKELVNIANLYPNILEDGWLVILNKELIEELDLKDKYKNVLTPNSVKTLFNKPSDELMDIAVNLPKAMKVTFIDLARKAYRKGELDKVRTINAIQDTFNISLEDNAPIKDIEE